jgi:hypothetical protein
MTQRNDRILSVKELARVEGDDAMYTRASRNFCLIGSFVPYAAAGESGDHAALGILESVSRRA